MRLSIVFLQTLLSCLFLSRVSSFSHTTTSLSSTKSIDPQAFQSSNPSLRYKLPLGKAGKIQQRLAAQNGDNNNNNNKSSQERDIRLEESRILIWSNRRSTIRSTLKFAHEIRALRLKNNPTQPQSSSSDAGKTALSWTAFGVAAGAVALRFGGRAALVSAVGLDFAKDNAELKEQMDQMLAMADQMNNGVEVFLFVMAWTMVKVLCFDAGGIVLALSSGILFGGVLQGAMASAAAATVGSCVCFALAKLDTPLRAKALEVVDTYPSLRGIEKVVATDGFKAILTLRLAPILPIPLGLYNYVYGVTNVPFLDFVAGIFLGSIKPYLLDSYLGYFGMSVVDGTVGDEMGYQDVILLLALGFSVLIGVFASQLAGETWDEVLKEVEVERKLKLAKAFEVGQQQAENTNSSDNTADNSAMIGIMMDALDVKTQIVDGMPLPDWLVDWQIAWGVADERIKDLIDAELEAQVWNYTSSAVLQIPPSINPALQPMAPEVKEMGQGVDLAQSILEGMVLTPALAGVFWKVSDPMYTRDKEEDDGEHDNDVLLRPSFAALLEQRKLQQQQSASAVGRNNRSSLGSSRITTIPSLSSSFSPPSSSSSTNEWIRQEWVESGFDYTNDDAVLEKITQLRAQVQRRVDRLESNLQQITEEQQGEEGNAINKR